MSSSTTTFFQKVFVFLVAVVVAMFANTAVNDMAFESAARHAALKNYKITIKQNEAVAQPLRLFSPRPSSHVNGSDTSRAREVLRRLGLKVIGDISCSDVEEKCNFVFLHTTFDGKDGYLYERNGELGWKAPYVEDDQFDLRLPVSVI